jgi:hypothetical protein
MYEETETIDLTSVRADTKCSFSPKAFDLAALTADVKTYAPAPLVAVTNKTSVDRAIRKVAEHKAIEAMLGQEKDAASREKSLYTPESLTTEPPTVFRYPGIEPELLLLDYGINGLDGAGPTLLLWRGKVEPITGICRGLKRAFRVNGIPYLQIGSRPCCECDAEGELRIYSLDDGGLSLVQVL